MRLAVKLGGAAITIKEREFTAREAVISRLASELARSPDVRLVVHGGGSFGHPEAYRYGLHEGGPLSEARVREGLARTHRAMERLNAIVMDALLDAGVPAVAVPPVAVCALDRGRIAELDDRAVASLAEAGMVPVLYGDAARDLSMGVGIVSGDQLLARLCPLLGVERAVLCSDVAGVFTADPKRDPSARRIDVLTPESLLSVSAGSSVASDVTRGMGGKVEELFGLARSGVESLVIDALKPGALARALGGARDHGTFIPVIP